MYYLFIFVILYSWYYMLVQYINIFFDQCGNDFLDIICLKVFYYNLVIVKYKFSCKLILVVKLKLSDMLVCIVILCGLIFLISLRVLWLVQN